MNYIKKIFFSTLFIAALAFAQVDVSVTVDPSAVQIGDKAELTLAVDYPDSVKIGFFAPTDSIIGGFNVVGFSVDSMQKDGSMIHQEIHYRLVYFNVGDGLIPPLGVIVVHSDNSTNTVLSQSVRINFLSLLEDEPIDSLDIKDIKQPHTVPFDYKQLAMNVLLGAGIVALIFGILWYLRLRKRGIGILEFIAPKKPPWELAFIQLDALAESDLLQMGEFKEYFDRLTDILRGYIEGRFGIQALELSTTETMENLRCVETGFKPVSTTNASPLFDLDSSLAEWFIATTELLLKRADMVKFAKFIPESDIALKDWQMVHKLIEDTIPKPVVEEGQAEIPEANVKIKNQNTNTMEL